MSKRVLVFLVCALVALLIYASRFLATPPMSKDALDFVGGLGVGLLVGALVMWSYERR